MAKYKKVDNCGPVAYPDQSGRYLCEGEVAEDDDANDWAPLVTLGFIVEAEGSAPVAAAPVPEPEVVPEPEPEVVSEPEPVAEVAPEKPKSRRSKKKKKEEVNDGMRSANDGDGDEGMDSSSSGESDS